MQTNSRFALCVSPNISTDSVNQATTSIKRGTMSLGVPFAGAQDPAKEKPYVLEETIVTARKREESLQEIPESIVARSLRCRPKWFQARHEECGLASPNE